MDYRIIIEASGDHGCDRTAVQGETLTHCGQPNCPDCLASGLVQKLQQRGASISIATITHGPGIGTPDEVVDDLALDKRTFGDFRPPASPRASAVPPASPLGRSTR